MSEPKSLTEFMRGCRKSLRRNQSAVAQVLGIAQQEYSQWETSGTLPNDPQKLVALAEALGTTTDQLRLYEEVGLKNSLPHRDILPLVSAIAASGCERCTLADLIFLSALQHELEQPIATDLMAQLLRARRPGPV
jgi:transcriptional regulator with XRE-family HTH domain